MVELKSRESSGRCFANDSGDVSVLRDSDAIQSAIEAIDVEDGVYDFYDGRGRVLVGVVEPHRRVIARPHPDGAVRPDELRGVLARYLHAVAKRQERPDLALGVERMGLAELVNRAVELDRPALRGAWLARLRLPGSGGQGTRRDRPG